MLYRLSALMLFSAMFELGEFIDWTICLDQECPMQSPTSERLVRVNVSGKRDTVCRLPSREAVSPS